MGELRIHAWYAHQYKPRKTTPMTTMATMFAQSYFHGTRADLEPGDEISVGFTSNFTKDSALSWVYFSSTLDAAIWGAELATGGGAERIYVVEPTGPIFDDPDLTDTRFPGNPTKSYRSKHSLRVIAEVKGWQGHPEEKVKHMKEELAKISIAGDQPIID